MCGIVCAFDIKSNSDFVRSNVLKMAKKVRHRGPDWSGIYSDNNAVLAHERLAIVDPTSGKQPIISDDGNKVIAVNGEIYNHKDLKEKYTSDYNFKTESDCEVIVIVSLSASVKYIFATSPAEAFSFLEAENPLVSTLPPGPVNLHTGAALGVTVK